MIRILVRALSLFIAMSIIVGCGSKSGERESDHRPNFLFLFADDQTYDAVGALGNDEVITPHLDALVARGLTFTHAFNQGSWSGAVCVVSRAMLASGRYIYHARDDLDRVPLWGEVMGNAGYQTFLTGKWHNGAATALKSFDVGKSVGRGMYETKDGKSGPGYYRPSQINNTWSPSDTSLLGHWAPFFYDIIERDSAKDQSEEYTMYKHTSEIYADNAIAFLSEAAEREDPFFMYVAFNAPHDPRQSPKRILDKYPVEQIDIPENYLPEHPFDQGEKNTLRDEILAPIPRSEFAVQTHRQEYYAIVTHMDEQIGRIIEALKESGEYENTYIIFTADHGLAVGKHGLLGKQNQYDHSIRVPYIIAGPNIPRNKKTDEMIYLQSTYPTVCELAGIEIPPTVEFRSLVSILESNGDGLSQIFGSYKDYQRMVRTKTHKLIVYPQVHQVQLFNLVDDPNELDNLADDENNEPLLDSLYHRLVDLQREVGDTLSLSLEL